MMNAIGLHVVLTSCLAAQPLPTPDAEDMSVARYVMNYRRAYLSEVCEDIQRHAGWLYAYPASLARRGTVTMEDCEIARLPMTGVSRAERRVGREALAAVAQSLGVSVEVTDAAGRTAAVFWKPADDARLAELVKQLRDKHEARACSAAAALGRLADKRAFSALIEALGDRRPRVQCWVFNALEDQIPPPMPGRLSILRWCLPEGGGKLIADGLAAAKTASEQARWLRLARAAAVIEAAPALEKILTTGPSGKARWLAADTLAELRQARSAGALLKAMTDDTDPTVRRRSADALSDLGKDIPFTPLKRVIDTHRSPEVQTLAVRVLARLPTSAGLKEMVRVLQYHPRIEVRAAAAQACASYPRRAMIVFLCTAVTKGKTPVIRAAAAEALGESLVRDDDADRVVSALLKALKEDASWLVRGRSAEAVGLSGWPPKSGVLLKAMSSDESAFVRCRAAEALVKLQDQKGFERLVKLLQGPDEERRIHAARALAHYVAVPRVVPALDRRKPAAVRHSAAWVLGQTFLTYEMIWRVGRRGALSAVAHLARAMKDDPDPGVRLTAARGLGRIADEKAIKALGEALASHPDVEVREVAAEALGRSGDAKAVASLLKVFADEDTDANLRVVVADALAELRDDASVEPLVKILKGPFHPGRRLAAGVLGRSRNPDVIEPLIWWMQNGPKGRDRASGALALGELGDPRAIDALVKAMNSDPHYRVWYGGAEALARIDDPRILRPLWRVMRRNDETPVRQSAARGLSTVRDPATVPRMIAFLSHRHRDLRDLGAQVLGTLRDPLAVEPLLKVLKNDTDEQVRESAAGALRAIDPDRPDVKAALEEHVQATADEM